MVAKKAGQFAGGFLNNPGAIAAVGIVTAILAALVIFRNDIRRFFGGFELPEITLPTINLPTINLPSFELPSFELPSFELPSFELPSFELPSFELPSFELPSFELPSFELPMIGDVDFTGSGQAGARGARGGGGGVGPIMAEPQPFFPPDFDIPISPGLLDDVVGPFMGGGPSFEGGFIFQTPIENLSLSQIIDMFNVTASQAADILAQARGFTPEEEAFLSQGPIDVGGFVSGGPPSVSDPAFQGLTPEEIANLLTGGPISQF